VGQLIGRNTELQGRLRRKIKEKMILVHKEKLGRNDELNREAWKISFFNLIQGFGFKIKDSNNCKLNLNRSQIEINLNKLFEDFSNLGLVKK
jgi:hypothetical protein